MVPYPPNIPPISPPHPPKTPIGTGPGPRAACGGRGGKGASYKQNMGQLYSRPPLPPHAALGPGPDPIGVLGACGGDMGRILVGIEGVFGDIGG